MVKPDIVMAKAHNIKLDKIKFPCIVEQKLSGHRLFLKKGLAFGRSPDTIGVWRNKWDTIPEHIQRLAANEWVDGEILWPGHDDSEIVTGLNEHPSEMEFVAFALPERYQTLYPDQHLIELRNLGFSIPFFLFATPRGFTYPQYFTMNSVEITQLLEEAKRKKWEGYILKERVKYPTWWKLKVTQTYDLLFSDFNISTRGKHKGKCKSICGSVFKNEDEGWIEIANVSGMNDEIRYSITEKDIGRVFEVEANLLAGQGRLRHPRFIRWRDDKLARECTYASQIGK